MLTLIPGLESHQYIERNYSPVVGRTKLKVYRGANKGYKEEAFAPWGFWSTQPVDKIY